MSLRRWSTCKEDPLCRAGNGPRDTGAAHRGHTTEGRRGADVERVRRAGLDHDLTDTLASELGPAEGRPGLAAVGRLVQADSGDAARAADVCFARPDVDGVAGRVVRVDGDRTDRVDAEGTREVLPARLARQRVLGAPDAAASGRDIQRAVTGLAGVGDRDGGRATTCDVARRHVGERAPDGSTGERLARTHRHPRSLAALAGRNGLPVRRERGARRVHLLDGDRPTRLRARAEALFGKGPRAALGLEPGHELLQPVFMPCCRRANVARELTRGFA